MDNKLTTLTETVMLDGRETTILAEFQRQKAEEHTKIRMIENNEHTSDCSMVIWNHAGETETFKISVPDFLFLRGQTDLRGGPPYS